MRSEQDFEKLVFERADKLKVHDRKMKIVRNSLMPLAAAFVVLTAVGIHGAFSMPNSSAKSDAAAPAEQTGGYSDYANAIQETAPAADAYEDNAAYDETYENEPQAKNYSGDANYAAEGKAAYSSSEHTAVMIAFEANGRTELTDPAELDDVMAILSSAPDEKSLPNTGYKGTLTVTYSDGAEETYYLYGDHLTSSNGSITLDDNEISLLSEYFNYT